MSALSEEVRHTLSGLASGWELVDVLIIFGSVAAGRPGASSDVDLYVRLVPGRARDAAAEDAFLAAASRACGREIDLVVESPSTSVILRREVASKGEPLFERRPAAFREFVVDAVRAYVDLEPQLRLIGEAIRRRATVEGTQARERLAAEAARGR